MRTLDDLIKEEQNRRGQKQSSVSFDPKYQSTFNNKPKVQSTTKPVQKPIVNNSLTVSKPKVQSAVTNKPKTQPVTGTSTMADKPKLYLPNAEMRSFSNNPIKNLVSPGYTAQQRLNNLKRDLSYGGRDLGNSFVKGAIKTLHTPVAIYNHYTDDSKYTGQSTMADKVTGGAPVKTKNQKFDEWLDKTYVTGNGKVMNTIGGFAGDMAAMGATGILGGMGSVAKATADTAVKTVGTQIAKRQLANKAAQAGIKISDKALTKVAEKKAAEATAKLAAAHPYIASLPRVTAENTLWGAGTYGVEKALGNEANLGEHIKNAQIFGHIIHGGVHGITGANKAYTNYLNEAMKPTKENKGNWVRNREAKRLRWKHNHPDVVQKLDNMQGQFQNILAPGRLSSNKNIADYQTLDMKLAKTWANPETLMNNDQVALIRTLENKRAATQEAFDNEVKSLIAKGVPEKQAIAHANELYGKELASDYEQLQSILNNKEKLNINNIESNAYESIYNDLISKGATEQEALNYMRQNGFMSEADSQAVLENVQRMNDFVAPKEPVAKETSSEIDQAFEDELAERIFGKPITVNKLNKIEQAIDNGTPVTKEAIEGKNTGYEPNKPQYSTNPTDDINLFEQARDYDVPQTDVGYTQTSVAPKQPTLELPKVKTNTKKTLAEWKSKYSTKDTPQEVNRPVKSSEGINTHEDIKTPQNESSYLSQNEHSVKELPKKIIEPEKSLDDMNVTKLEAGEAEGANTSYSKINKKSIKESDALDNGLAEEVPNSGRFASEDAEFNSWYDKYEKADADTRAKMLEEKANSFSKREDGLDFYNKFSEQIDRDKVAFDRNKPSGFKGLSKEYKPSVNETDLMNFASKFKNVDSLSSAAKEAKVHNKELTNQIQELSGKQVLEILGFGKGNKGVNPWVAKRISKFGKDIGKSFDNKFAKIDKDLEMLAFGKLNKQKSKMGLDQLYKQMQERINGYKQNGINTYRVEEALNKAYRRKLKDFGIDSNNNGTKPDLAFRRQKARDMNQYNASADSNRRVHIANDIIKDMVNEVGKDNQLFTISDAIKKATDARTGKYHLSNNQDNFNYFNAKDRSVLENTVVLETNGLPYSNAEASGKYNTIMIKNGANVDVEFRHEGQHIIDYQTEVKIENLADGDPIKEAKEICDNAYFNSINIVNNLSNNIISHIDNLGIKDKLSIEAILPTKKNISSFNLANFKNVVNNIFANNKQKANEIIEWATHQEIYLKDPREIRSYNAENLIQNTVNLEDALLNRANELKGNNNGFNKPNNGSGGKGTKPDLSGDGRSGNDSIQTSRRTENSRNNTTNSRRNKVWESNSSEQPTSIKQYRISSIGTKGLNDKNVTKVLSTINDSETLERTAKTLRENTLKRVGLLEDEQALKAIAKQTGDGSVWIQTTVPKNKKASLKLGDDNYNTKQGKAGVFGNREIGDIHTTSRADRVKDDILTSIKADAAHDTVTFATDTWGVPIDREVSGEWVNVNKKLLTQAIFLRNSREWYNTIARGGNHIDVAFKKQPKVAEYYKKLHETIKNPDCKIPREVFNTLFEGSGESASQYMERYWNMKYPVVGSWTNRAKGVGKFIGGVFDGFNNVWKRNKLATLSFVINNRLGNQMLLAMQGGKDYFTSFIDAAKTKDLDIPNEILEANIGEAFSDFIRKDNTIKRTYTDNNVIDGFFNIAMGVPIEKINTAPIKKAKIAYGGKLSVAKNKYEINSEGSLDKIKIKHDGKTPGQPIGNYYKHKWNKEYKNFKSKAIPKGTTFKKSIANKNDTVKNRAINVLRIVPNIQAGLGKVFNKYAEGINTVNNAFERFERKQAYFIAKKHIDKQKMKTFLNRVEGTKAIAENINDNPEMKEAILINIEDMLGNYRTFNKVEKNFLKRIRPFYSWDRTITRATISLAKKNPVRAAFVLNETKHLQDVQDDRPDYQQGSIDLPIKDSRNGKQLLINKREYGIPYASLPGMESKPIYEGASDLVRVPIEMIRGKKFFLNSDFNDKRYFAHKVRDGKKYITKYYDIKTGKDLDKLPLMPRIGYGITQLGTDIAMPYMNNNLIQGNNLVGLFDKTKDGKRVEYDTPFDTSLGGFRDKDKVGVVTKTSKRGYKYKSTLRRHSAQNTSEATKLLKRTGLGIQTKSKLNYWDKLERKEKEEKENKRKESIQKWKNKFKK